MSTKCFTPSSEYYDKFNTTGTNNEKQVSDEIFMPIMEFQTLLCNKLKKIHLYPILQVHICKEDEEKDLIQLRLEMEVQFNDVKNHDVL